jgi:DNA-binding NarL/FixJ family response regulator
VNDPIKVLIVSDDDLLRQRMRTVLESATGFTIVGQTQDGGEAIDLIHGMCRETHPDVVLLEIDTPHTSNLETVAQIRALFPHIRIIVLNDDGQQGSVLEAFRKGALGHLVKDRAQPTEIVNAIRAVSRGKAIINSNVAGRMLDQIVQNIKLTRDEFKGKQNI